MKPGTVKGQKLSAADHRAIRDELVGLAKQTGSRAFTVRYDGDGRFEFRAWPNGKMVKQPLDDAVDISVDVPRLLSRVGVDARIVQALVAAVPVVVAVLESLGVLG